MNIVELPVATAGVVLCSLIKNNLQVFLCEAMFFMLEYFKTVAFCWMFLEGFYLHNQLVFTVFEAEPHLTPYLMAGYGNFHYCGRLKELVTSMYFFYKLRIYLRHEIL